MAFADVVDSRLVRIWLADSPTGITNRICAMTTKAFNQTKETNDQVIPDCDNPAGPGLTRRTPLSIDQEITGTLLYEPVARPKLDQLLRSPVSGFVSFEIPHGAAGTGGGYYHGRFFLTQFNIVGSEAEFLTADVIWKVDARDGVMAVWQAR